MKKYTFLVVNEELNVIDISAHDQEDGYIIVGEKIDKKDDCIENEYKEVYKKSKKKRDL